MNLNKKSILFISLLFSSMLIINCVNLTGNKTLQENNTNKFSIKNLRSSAENISNSDIIRNITQVRRYYDTINITLINLDKFGNASELYTFINVSFTNGTKANYSMTPPSKNYSYWCFTPSINATPGLQNVSFQIFNSTWDLLNTQETNTSFTILNNLPYCSAYLSTTKIYRNQVLNVNISLWDVEDRTFDLNWKTTIVDQSYNEKKSIGFNISTFQQTIDGDFSVVNAIYYIKVNITDTDNNSVHYFPFEVINSPPQIVISPINTIIITPEDRVVKRSSESVKITLNVTDIENSSPSDVDVKLKIEDTNGAEEQLDFTNNGDGSYKLEFNITASKPMGWYDLTIIAEDQNGGTDEHSDYLIVENNPPEILGYYINNMSTENNISIGYGLDLVFTFNISDVEEFEGLGFVKVCLLNSENKWYNVSNRYSENGSITIRTVDLIGGKWLVYIFVIDADGAEVGLDIGFDDAPQEIEIIPDISPIITWIFIISAIIFGFGFGYIISFILNSRKREEITKTIEKEEVKKIKPSDKTKKIVKKKDKKIKKKPEEAEKDEEPAHKEKSEEEELKPKSQLKIKRKIR